MVRQILICASARSGSTLLDLLLGRHPRIESLGEINFLGKAIARGESCSCGSKVVDCTEWKSIFDAVQEDYGVHLLENPYGMMQWDTKIENVHADLNQQTRMYLLARALRRAGALLHHEPALAGMFPLPRKLRHDIKNAFDFYDLVRRNRKALVIVDSSKEILKALSIYREDPEGTRLIMLCRDGRAVMYSRLRSGISTGESASTAIDNWRRYYGRAVRLIRHFAAPEHVYQIRYEDLATAPEAEMARLITWLGKEFEPDWSFNSNKQQHLVGGNEGTKRKITDGIKLDERWRSGLSDNEIALFHRLTGSLNRQLGYE